MQGPSHPTRVYAELAQRLLSIQDRTKEPKNELVANGPPNLSSMCPEGFAAASYSQAMLLVLIVLIALTSGVRAGGRRLCAF